MKNRASALHILEDGFLRSVGRRDAALGIAFDDDGIYYDAHSNSRLFRLIKRDRTTDEIVRARSLQAAWVKLRLSKYNDAAPLTHPLPKRFVLVVDQVRGDLSVAGGLADESAFKRMLHAALAENPDHTIVVKLHPDSLDDPARRHFEIDELRQQPRVEVIAQACEMAQIIEHADSVYTVTSQVGFEALLWNKPVRCFGMPFYAGWGLTDDDLPPPQGRCDVTLEQLVYAALIEYARYWHPVLQQEVGPEEIFELVRLNRDLKRAFPDKLYAMGFSRWKKPFIGEFLSGKDIEFVESLDDVPYASTLVVWGNRTDTSQRPDLSIVRAEDGFLRSSGLGAYLVRPLSLVIDATGIYYDSTRPSGLERILETGNFLPRQIARAAALRARIISAGINKYNLGGSEWTRPEGAKHVLLVVGQVEGDASIQFGSPVVRSNLELLRQVRNENPDAYIVYKPHPDVVAGLRTPGSDDGVAADYCDELLIEADTNKLLTRVDAVHTMTSLLGFEALLRGVPVICHGLPFYAGWGLTEDRVSCPRRTQRRSLDELVYATLIEYPRYFSERGQMFAQPEHILVELAHLAEAGPITTLQRAKSPAKKWRVGVKFQKR